MRHLGLLFRSCFTLSLFALASAVSAQRITGLVDNTGANLPAAMAASAPAESKTFSRCAVRCPRFGSALPEGGARARWQAGRMGGIDAQ